MSDTRIYTVTPTDAGATPEPRLIEASSKGQALRHATAGMFEVRPASGKEVAAGMKAGIQVEIAGCELPIDSSGGHAD
jgi:hypothetical protein